jgi:hypothetical protein
MINVLKIQNTDTLDLEDKILQLGLKVDKIKTENDKFIKVSILYLKHLKLLKLIIHFKINRLFKILKLNTNM